MDELLYIFDNNPSTYAEWAEEYFEDDVSSKGIAEATVQDIYNGNTLTRKMALSVVDEVDDWEQLCADMEEINYPFDFTE